MMSSDDHKPPEEGSKLNEAYERFKNFSEEEKRFQERLREIQAEETAIRAARAQIYSEKPWYKNPLAWIAIAGVIVSLVAYLTNFWLNYKRKELVWSNSQPTSLLLITPSVKSRTDVTFDGKPVPGLGRSVVVLKNTGTQGIQASDFKDGPLRFTITAPSKDAMPSSGNKLPLLLDVVPKSSAGQRKADIKIISRDNPAVFTYLPSLLNRNDTVELELITTVIDGTTVSASGKILDGKLFSAGVTDDGVHSASITERLRLLWIALINVLGSKITAVILIGVALVLSIIAFAIIWGYMEPHYYWPEYVFQFLFSLPVLLSIWAMISVILTRQ